MRCSCRGNRTVRFENSENLVTCKIWLASFSTPYSLRIESKRTSNNLDLSNTVRVSEDNTDLGWSCTLLGELANLVDNLLGGSLQPRGRSAGVRESGG